MSEPTPLPSDRSDGQPALTLPRPAAFYLDRLRELLPDLRARYHVARLWLFGSYVRAEQTPASDLDLLVEYAETPGLLGLVGLEQELSDRLGVKVDLVMRSALKPRVAPYVLREVVEV